MGAGGLVGAFVDLLMPAVCGGCGVAGTCWCAGCRGAVRLSSPGVSVGVPIHAAGRYGGPLRTALLAYKERGRRDLGPSLADLLAAPLGRVRGDPLWLVPAPSRPAAARARGGDHVLRLCRLRASRDPRVRVAPALRLARGARDSVGLDAAQRRANLAGRLRVRVRGLPPAGAQVVLVDDVVTTGATVAACHAVLAAAGVRIEAAVVLCDAAASAPTRRS